MIEVIDTISNWLFKGWESIGRVILVGVLAYAGLLLFLRISGKRTLSKMNAFDLVVTVALGSTLSTIIVSRQTGVADGLTALAILILLQYSVAWLSIRWSWFRHAIKGGRGLGMPLKVNLPFYFIREPIYRGLYAGNGLRPMKF